MGNGVFIKFYAVKLAPYINKSRFWNMQFIMIYWYVYVFYLLNELDPQMLVSS